MEPYRFKERKEQYEAARLLRQDGYGYRTISKKIGINHSTVRNWVQDIKCDKYIAHKLSRNEIPFESLKSKDAIRRRLIEERGNICEQCGTMVWGIYDEQLPLEVHHINGKENTETNLILLCPNCHSLTKNWRGRK